jgi:signal peptidase I
VLVAVMVVLFTTTFAVQNSVIPTASMEDTLLIGDYLLVNKVVLAPADAAAPTRWLGQRPLRHGDVVVFKFPNNPAVDYVKRVIGLPGDVLELRDKQLFRNGEAPDEPYKRHKTGITYPRGTPGQDGTRDNLAPVTVPEGREAGARRARCGSSRSSRRSAPSTATRDGGGSGPGCADVTKGTEKGDGPLIEKKPRMAAWRRGHVDFLNKGTVPFFSVQVRTWSMRYMPASPKRAFGAHAATAGGR